ncbi:MAG: hypothetical protein RLZ97_175, partial [Verrucomicrobiota bacterium]
MAGGFGRAGSISLGTRFDFSFLGDSLSKIPHV